MSRVLVLNGPNVNLLGSRQPEIYGSTTYEELVTLIRDWGERLGLTIEVRQSNSEGEMITLIQGAAGLDGLVINPGAFTHTSRAIADAVAALDRPSVEVHISDIENRETWRRSSTLSGLVGLRIFGRGVRGYRDGLRYIHNQIRHPAKKTRYGPLPDHFANSRNQSDDNPVAVLIHGGFWLPAWGLDTTDSWAVDLAEHGYETHNLEYRRDGGRGWVGSLHDVEMATAFLGRGRDLVLIGHSVGGTMAVAARVPSGSPRRIAIAPVVDLEAMAAGSSPGAIEAGQALQSGAPARIRPTGQSTLLAVEGDEEVPSQAGAASSPSAERSTGETHFSVLRPSSPTWKQVIEIIGSGSV